MGVDRSELSRPSASWAGRRVVVTGSAGFIGSHIAASLLASGALVHEIRGRLDCDLRDGAATRARIAEARPEVVVHLAANPDRPGSAGAEETVAMTANLLAALDPFPACLVIHTGSYKQYGRAPLPFQEAGPARPVTAYGRAKHQSERMILAAAAAGRIRGVGLRIGPVYGPRQHPATLIPTLVRHALGLGAEELTLADRAWDPVYVTDVSEAILRAGDRREAWGQSINISGGRAFRPAEVLDMVAELAGREAPDHVVREDPGPPPLASYGEVGRAAELLGWFPEIPLRTGLRLMFDSLTDERAEEFEDDLVAPVAKASAPAS